MTSLPPQKPRLTRRYLREKLPRYLTRHQRYPAYNLGISFDILEDRGRVSIFTSNRHGEELYYVINKKGTNAYSIMETDPFGKQKTPLESLDFL